MPKAAHHRGWREAALAALLLLSFFMPWLYSMGHPVAAHQIRERLAGPHRLISTFISGSRVSRDYRLSIFLYAVPFCAGLVLALVAAGKYRPWMGALAGGVALIAVYFLRGEVAGFPFHRLAAGAYLAMAAGIGLAVSPLLRLGSRFQTSRGNRAGK
ncbi:MAG: hypothetical protein JWO30_1453 [Fibrobacteres bacterium]|nr:hypothetical protein [Fibrobacterota bacterium]